MKACKGNRSVDPLILNLNTRWRWVVNVTLRPLYSPGKNPGTPGLGGWVETRAGLDVLASFDAMSLNIGDASFQY